ncbi:MAG: hypothetical protein WD038_08880 [Balneolales bacterium]
MGSILPNVHYLSLVNVFTIAGTARLYIAGTGVSPVPHYSRASRPVCDGPGAGF